MKVVLTGASGLLGAQLLNDLLTSGHEVVSVGRSQPKFESNPLLTLVKLDLSEPLGEHHLPDHVDVVMHVAQSRNFRKFPDRASDLFAVNTHATSWLANYAYSAGAKTFVYFSTGAVYSPKDRPSFGENDPLVRLDEANPYAASKIAAEYLLQAFRTEMKILVLRPFFIYGKGQDRSMLLPRLFDSVSNGVAIQLRLNDGVLLNPIHVTDASSLVLHSLEKDLAGTYNLAGPEVLSLKQIAEAIGGEIGVRPNFVMSASGPTQMVGNTSNLDAAAGSAVITLKERIAELAIKGVP